MTRQERKKYLSYLIRVKNGYVKDLTSLGAIPTELEMFGYINITRQFSGAIACGENRWTVTAHAFDVYHTQFKQSLFDRSLKWLGAIGSDISRLAFKYEQKK